MPISDISSRMYGSAESCSVSSTIVSPELININSTQLSSFSESNIVNPITVKSLVVCISKMLNGAPSKFRSPLKVKPVSSGANPVNVAVSGL